MKYTGRERGVGSSASEDIDEMIDRSRTAGGDHGDAYRFADSGGEVAIESRPRSVGIHGREQDFARAAILRFARPFDHATTGGLTAALYEDLRVTDKIGSCGIAARIDSDDDGL